MVAMMQMMLANPARAWRYFRWRPTKHLDATTPCAATVCELQLLVGATKYPTANMTSDSAPSPLVATASSILNSSFEAHFAFDGVLTDVSGSNLWVAANNADASGNIANEWIQIDLGAGTFITPTEAKISYYRNLANGDDRTWVDFTLKASNSGLFAGEEVTLLAVTGQASQSSGVLISYPLVY